MTDSPNRQKMPGGYGSDDKVEMETGDEVVSGTNDADASQIPGVVADIPTESSNNAETDSSSPANAVDLGSDAANVDNLSGGASDYTSGGGTSGFGKGS